MPRKKKTPDQLVRESYDENPDKEWDRLAQHPTEFEITRRIIVAHLPQGPLDILDVGGGPGRYAISLARDGHRVTLLDISWSVMRLAERKALEAGVRFEMICGDARNLSPFPDRSFDAVLLLGPLYHIVDPEGRKQAISEARRVLRPGGLVFAAFINLLSVVKAMAMSSPGLIRLREEFEKMLETGTYIPLEAKEPGWSGFTAAWFAHPREINPLMESAGFSTLELVNCEGFLTLVEEKLAGLSPQEQDAWLELNHRFCRDPWLLGSAEHLLYVGKLSR